MSKITQRVGRKLVVLAVLSVFVVPCGALASHGESIPSQYRSKVKKLGTKIVKELSVPMLFGVALDDLWPNFGEPRDGGKRKHEGLDIMAPIGTPLISPTEAVVIKTGTGDRSGKYVTTANPGGETFSYMHLEKIVAKKGEVLPVGGIIGYVGDTGNAKGGPAHLHFEIRKGRKPIDPFPRFTDELTPAERLASLERLLKVAKNNKTVVANIAEAYAGDLYMLERQGMTLPKVIVDALPTLMIPSRDIALDDEGMDVRALQQILIKEGFLDLSSPTGYFGPLSQAALKAYQQKHSITPASGVYGPQTRVHMQTVFAKGENQSQVP